MLMRVFDIKNRLSKAEEKKLLYNTEYLQSYSAELPYE